MEHGDTLNQILRSKGDDSYQLAPKIIHNIYSIVVYNLTTKYNI